MTFTWTEGRWLDTVTKNGNTYSYMYNGEGDRVTKMVGEASYQYNIVDGVLYGESRYDSTSAVEIYYFYDENGTMYGFSYNGIDYYYRLNLQGDVTGIYNSSGQIVTEYTYDAWGKVLSVTGSLASTIGQTNPIRYRGYYYDSETGFYFLQTRYYDPETGRFINADGQLNADSMLGYNLFAYCGNNPVNFADPNGKNFIEAVIGAGMIVAVAAFFTFLSVMFSTPTVQQGLYDVGQAIGKAVSSLITSAATAIRDFTSSYKKVEAEEKVDAVPKTIAPPFSVNYWAADLVKNQVIISNPLTVEQASMRVSMGGSIMCSNEAAAKHIIYRNRYFYAVGPERHHGGYLHYHPTRNHTGTHSIHIWFYG